MKGTTKKLSGIGLDLFLRRHYASYPEIDDALARKLSEDGVKTFASARVRRAAWRDWLSGNTAAKPALTREVESPPPATEPPPIAEPAAKPPPVAVVVPPADTEAAPFDPYAIGLIPTYQREGADGLAAKLADVESLDNLRKMARSQQVALPADLRGADADIGAVRTAIVSAVGKRIANRRAAAG